MSFFGNIPLDIDPEVAAILRAKKLAEPEDCRVQPPQEVADKLALAAQFYAGSLVGHPFRSAQYGKLNTSRVDKARVWRAKAIVPDDCLFCEPMTDEDIVRRIAGYQHQIDIEVLSRKVSHSTAWITVNKDVPEPGINRSALNRRRFAELFQDVKTETRPSGWKERPFPLVSLSMLHKRKLCATWNHILLEWMEENGLHYDFEDKQFLREPTRPPADVSASDD